MKIFTQEFTDFLKQAFWCSWRGHKKGKWRPQKEKLVLGFLKANF